MCRRAVANDQYDHTGEKIKDYIPQGRNSTTVSLLLGPCLARTRKSRSASRSSAGRERATADLGRNE